MHSRPLRGAAGAHRGLLLEPQPTDLPAPAAPAALFTFLIRIIAVRITAAVTHAKSHPDEHFGGEKPLNHEEVYFEGTADRLRQVLAAHLNPDVVDYRAEDYSVPGEEDYG